MLKSRRPRHFERSSRSWPKSCCSCTPLRLRGSSSFPPKKDGVDPLFMEIPQICGEKARFRPCWFKKTATTLFCAEIRDSQISNYLWKPRYWTFWQSWMENLKNPHVSVRIDLQIDGEMSIALRSPSSPRISPPLSLKFAVDPLQPQNRHWLRRFFWDAGIDHSLQGSFLTTKPGIDQYDGAKHPYNIHQKNLNIYEHPWKNPYIFQILQISIPPH